MKRLFKTIWNYFKGLKTRWDFRKINKKLGKKVSDREVDRIILKDKIVKSVKKYVNIEAKSKYIPLDRKSKEKIKQKVLADFGQEMSKLHLRLNENLKICDC